MANRVCVGQRSVGAYGLWVSKPGVDVLTAAPSNLVFSSDWAQLGRYGGGTVNVNWTSGVFDRTIPWGKTFPSSPIAFVWVISPTGTYLPQVPGGSFFYETADQMSTPNWRNISVASTPAGLRIVTEFAGTTIGAVPPITFIYTVMDYNL